MLSKLLKYEFRATGRIMLPVYALLLVTAGGTSVTGSLMGRYPESTVLSIFRTLFMTLFAFTTFGVLLLTLVLMVYRFYKNLMTDEGYLMFTLPVSRSQLIWSKLIVSMAWGILSAVLAALMWTMVLSVAGGENLFAGIFRGLRSLMESLSGNATGCIVGLVVLLLAAELASYLRFYAAISLGHSFSNHKLLLSVVFYIGFGIAVQTILSVVTAAGIRIDVDPDFWVDPPAAVLLSYVIWGTAAWSVLECAAYYIPLRNGFSPNNLMNSFIMAVPFPFVNGDFRGWENLVGPHKKNAPGPVVLTGPGAGGNRVIADSGAFSASEV